MAGTLIDDDFGEEEFMDEDTKLLSRLRKKNRKLGIDILNRADITDRDLDELFAEA